MVPEMTGMANTHIRRISLIICVASICIFLVYVSTASISTSTDMQFPDHIPAIDSLYNHSYYKSNEYSPNIWSNNPVDWSRYPGKHTDIMNMKPLEFLPTFKNPCWYCNRSLDDSCRGQLHCLPYFYIIGVKKCGTTDLHIRIHNHPDTRTNWFKEAQWFANRRFGRSMFIHAVAKTVLKNEEPRNIRFYIKMFDRAASYLANKAANASYVNSIMADSSPSNFHNHGNWDQLPGNIGLTEPRFTNFHYIKHLLPGAKIIIIFRDPTDRLYSDYQHTAKVRGTTHQISPQRFHDAVVEQIQIYEKCFDQYSIRRCIYNYELKLPTFDFHAGFYAFFMNDLLSVFSNDQVLPLLFSDYVTNMSQVLSKAFSFLGLRPLSNQEMERALRKSPANSSKQNKRKIGPMMAETRKLLNEFYKPYNREMAQLMNDNRYLFKNIRKPST